MHAHSRCNARIYNVRRCIRLVTRHFLTFFQINSSIYPILSETTELTKFERGVITEGWWLFGHTEREIEAKTGQRKSTVHDTLERYCKSGGETSRPRSRRPQYSLIGTKAAYCKNCSVKSSTFCKTNP